MKHSIMLLCRLTIPFATIFCLSFASASDISIGNANDVASNSDWSESELNIIESLSIDRLPALPNSPSNAYADDERAQQFGKALFYDTQFSGNKNISCASCHQPENHFVDSLPRAVGLHATGRNTPTIIGVGWQRWFYWDGRKDSLWSQALIPFEASDEMGSNRVSVVKKIISEEKYNKQYTDLFGHFPMSLNQATLALEAGTFGSKVMQNNWHRLSAEIQRSINQVYVNVGKSLAAYQRTLSYKPTVFDHYAKQLKQGGKKEDPPLTDDTIFTEEQIAGLKLFINEEKTQCLQCHNTALFSNRGFHNIGSGNFSGARLDFGRMFGLQAVLLDEFNCLGAYSDASQDQCTALKFLNKNPQIPLKGAFKTPGLRNVSQTRPYFHDGRFTTLTEVVEFYNKPPKNNGPHELLPMGLNSVEVSQLVSFLESLAEVQ